MAAPKGNQNAAGHGCGRPCKYNLEQEAKELLEFSLSPDATSIYQFVNPKDYDATQLVQFCEQSVIFSQAYKKAKQRIGLNRELKLHSGKFNETVYKKSVGIYDVLQHEYDRAEKLFDAECKKLAGPTTNVTINTVQELIDQNPNASKDLVNEANS